MQPLDPYAAAQALLDAFVAAWPSAAPKLPKVQYVAEGAQVPWDGEQVTVIVGGIAPGLPSSPGAASSRPRGAFPMTTTLTLELVRSRAAGLSRQGGRQTALPSKSQSARAGEAYGADLTRVLEILLAIRENGSVVSHATKIGLPSVRPTGPDGDLVGTAGTVAILLGHH